MDMDSLKSRNKYRKKSGMNMKNTSSCVSACSWIFKKKIEENVFFFFVCSFVMCVLVLVFVSMSLRQQLLLSTLDCVRSMNRIDLLIRWAWQILKYKFFFFYFSLHLSRLFSYTPLIMIIISNEMSEWWRESLSIDSISSFGGGYQTKNEKEWKKH